jgi:hypothetical protein
MDTNPFSLGLYFRWGSTSSIFLATTVPPRLTNVFASEGRNPHSHLNSILCHHDSSASVGSRVYKECICMSGSAFLPSMTARFPSLLD